MILNARLLYCSYNYMMSILSWQFLHVYAVGYELCILKTGITDGTNLFDTKSKATLLCCLPKLYSHIVSILS